MWCRQHKASNYVARPIAKHQTCDTELATAPLFRRGADGIRQMYADEPMDSKKSRLVHPPVRPYVPATDTNASHDKRKFARTYKIGQSQTETQALAFAQAQLSFAGTGAGTAALTTGEATATVDLSQTQKGLKPQGAAALEASSAAVYVLIRVFGCCLYDLSCTDVM